jgi:hypothetical protein
VDPDIYPWYEKERWFKERFTGDRFAGWERLRTVSLDRAPIYFRESYASVRMGGFEYACLDRHGALRYGQKNRRLKENECPPQDLVAALRGMFQRLAESNGDTGPVKSWVDSAFPPKIADFIRYAAEHHQPEHWLESMLVERPEVLCGSYDSPRSQVVVGYVGERPWGFTDLLVLDRRNREVVVVEFKVPKATGEAVRQVRRYAEWFKLNLRRLLDPEYGYFRDVEDPAAYRVTAALVAQSFTRNLPEYVNEAPSACPIQRFRINDNWRTEIKAERVPVPEGRGHGKKIAACGIKDEDTTSGVSLGFGRDELRKRIIARAAATGLRHHRIQRDEQRWYDDLDGPRGVVAQIHAHCGRPDSLVLVRRQKDSEGLVEHLEACDIGDRLLSGDFGPNMIWLRGEKKNAEKGPADPYWVPVHLAAELDNRPGWQDVNRLVRLPEEWW